MSEQHIIYKFQPDKTKYNSNVETKQKIAHEIIIFFLERERERQKLMACAAQNNTNIDSSEKVQLTYLTTQPRIFSFL